MRVVNIDPFLQVMKEAQHFQQKTKKKKMIKIKKFKTKTKDIYTHENRTILHASGKLDKQFNTGGNLVLGIARTPEAPEPTPSS